MALELLLDAWITKQWAVQEQNENVSGALASGAPRDNLGLGILRPLTTPKPLTQRHWLLLG